LVPLRRSVARHATGRRPILLLPWPLAPRGRCRHRGSAHLTINKASDRKNGSPDFRVLHQGGGPLDGGMSYRSQVCIGLTTHPLKSGSIGCGFRSRKFGRTIYALELRLRCRAADDRQSHSGQCLRIGHRVRHADTATASIARTLCGPSRSSRVPGAAKVISVTTVCGSPPISIALTIAATA